MWSESCRHQQLTWDQRDITYRTALELACAAGHVELVEAMLEWDPDTKVPADYLVRASIDFGNEDLVLRVLSLEYVETSRTWWRVDDLVKCMMTRRMFDALRGLHLIRPRYVEMAIDIYAFGEDALVHEPVVIESLPPDIQVIVKRVRSDRLRRFIRPMMILRHRCNDIMDKDVKTARESFAVLPDFAIMRVLAFGRPLLANDEVAECES